MFIKPIHGRTVLNPENNMPLSQEGSEVEDNQYWQRRLADGDVEEIAQADKNLSSAETEETSKPDESNASTSPEEPDKSNPKKSVKKT